MAPGSPLPLVSVITPCLNHAPYLRDTIESVLAQDYPNIEHIVVDGGSTDGTIEILRTYGERYPERFRWCSEPDQGQSDAFNKGLALARGEFIGWQNSDDYYFPNVFAEPIRHLMAHPDTAAVYSDCLLVDAAGGAINQFPIRPFNYVRLLDDLYILNQAAFFRRDALLECGGLALDLHYSMDYDLFVRLGMRHRLAYLPGVRGAFRILPTAKTQAGRFSGLLERVTHIQRVLGDPAFPSGLLGIGRYFLVRHTLRAASEALLLGRIEIAERLLRQALNHGCTGDHWRYFYQQFLNAPFAFYGPGVNAAAPRLTACLLEDLGVSRALYTDQCAALAHLYRSTDYVMRRQRRLAVSEVVQALRVSPWWLRFGGGRAILARAFFGQSILYDLVQAGGRVPARLLQRVRPDQG
jgi:glycosyltransferase involved in cell wall biosynthesis